MKKIFFIFIIIALVNIAKSNDLENRVLAMIDELIEPVNSFLASGTLSSAETLGGLPHFEVGGGIDIRKISYTDPNTNQSFDIFLPLPFAQGRIGIFSGFPFIPTINILSLDAGVKGGIIPIASETTIEKNPTIIGGEIRIGLLKGLPVPSISLSATYNKLSGLEIGTKQDAVYTAFDFSTLGLTILASKKLIFFTPYVGVGINKNCTKVKYEILKTGKPISRELKLESEKSKTLVGVKISFFLLSLFAEYNYVSDNSVFAIGAKLGF